MPADRAQANQGVGKLPKRIPASLRPLLPEMGGKHCRERPRGNTESEIKHLIQENSKPQVLIVHTVYIVSPKTSQGGASLSSKVRLSSMKTVQSIRSQSPAWQWRWKQSPVPSAGLSDHTCRPPHWFNELAAKSEKWTGKPRLEYVNGRHPPSKTPVGVLPWTCRSEEKWPSRQTVRKSNPPKWLASRKLRSAEELETLPSDTKPRTSHHCSLAAKRRALPSKDETEPSSVRRTLETFQRGNVGETSERQSGAHVRFSERIDTILNWPELTVRLRNTACNWRKYKQLPLALYNDDILPVIEIKLPWGNYFQDCTILRAFAVVTGITTSRITWPPVWLKSLEAESNAST